MRVRTFEDYERRADAREARPGEGECQCDHPDDDHAPWCPARHRAQRAGAAHLAWSAELRRSP